MTKKLKINTNTVRAVMEELSPKSATTYCDDDDRMYALKEAITRLSDKDRCILALLIDEGSQRKLAQRLGCSASLVNQMIKRIRQQIKDELL